MNCWEFKKCGKSEQERCPAYPDKGLQCWKVTGTMCGNGRIAKATLAEKIEFCRQCDFYIKFASKF